MRCLTLLLAHTALAPLPSIVMTEHKAKLIEQWEADSAALTHRAAQEFRSNAEASKKAQEVLLLVLASS